MENRINIAELLKDCPKGMELDCATWENVTFEKVVSDKIYIKRNNKKHPHDNIVVLNQYGCTTNHQDEKCRIFPKGKTTWEGFVPFVKGDIIYTDGFVAILYNVTESGTLWYYCYYSIWEDCCKIKTDYGIGNVNNNEVRLATEEEKQKLFYAIKANGYKWNEETKTLEKLPKFKVGDRVQRVLDSVLGLIVKVDDKGYYINFLNNNNGVGYISFILEKDYVLVPNKFDITTLVPFESKVLVRDINSGYWIGAFYSHYNSKKFYTIGGSRYYQCIPYEGNEHLLDTTNDCDGFYKTWE